VTCDMRETEKSEKEKEDKSRSREKEGFLFYLIEISLRGLNMPQVPRVSLTMVEPANSQGLRGIGINYCFPQGIT
jgi:hypothetical protein